MPRIFHDEDVDSTALRDETIAIIGYGIQGRAQALNLRDSGARVVIGNRRDQYASQAEADGFEVLSIHEAVERGTIVLFLLPDEVQPYVFRAEMQGELVAGQALIFAHGFSVRYGLVDPPETIESCRNGGGSVRRRLSVRNNRCGEYYAETRSRRPAQPGRRWRVFTRGCRVVRPLLRPVTAGNLVLAVQAAPRPRKGIIPPAPSG